MRARMLIGAGLAAALAGATAIYLTPASAHGWGMMGGYGPGGAAAGDWNCPGFGRGGYGPEMMGYGYGDDRQTDGQTGENLNLTNGTRSRPASSACSLGRAIRTSNSAM